ncbi:MAG: GAF domain-containing protein [Nannocystaceae bacterium]|nr:GAF domain-containing protein [bacterium]
MQQLPLSATASKRAARYDEVGQAIASLLEDEDDWVSAMATVACELHHGFAYFHWTGFYRVVQPAMLAVGPYQGGHGCLRIPFERGVCGAAARTRTTQRVDDVEAFPGHIACSSSTRSEIVVPVLGASGETMAVLDVDSNDAAAFGQADEVALVDLCEMLGARYGAAR